MRRRWATAGFTVFLLAACGNGNIDTWGLTNRFGTCGNTTGPL